MKKQKTKKRKRKPKKVVKIPQIRRKPKSLEKRWLDNWSEGMSKFVSSTPRKSRRKMRSDYDSVMKMLEEKKPELKKMSHKWKMKLRQALCV